MFNIRNYSPEVSNIQRREAKLNIILPTVNNVAIKQKSAWNIYFVIYSHHQTKFWLNAKKAKKKKKKSMSAKLSFFFFKNSSTIQRQLSRTINLNYLNY